MEKLAFCLPGRWIHVQAVAAKATTLTAVVPNADVLVAAAWLHDIGYAPDIAETGLHALDGARWMGHVDGSVQARYTHITAKMRARLMDDLTEMWEAALDERLAMSPRSPMLVLDHQLRGRAARWPPKIFSPISPTRPGKGGGPGLPCGRTGPDLH